MYIFGPTSRTDNDTAARCPFKLILPGMRPLASGAVRDVCDAILMRPMIEHANPDFGDGVQTVRSRRFHFRIAPVVPIQPVFDFSLCSLWARRPRAVSECSITLYSLSIRPATAAPEFPLHFDVLRRAGRQSTRGGHKSCAHTPTAYSDDISGLYSRRRPACAGDRNGCRDASSSWDGGILRHAWSNAIWVIFYAGFLRACLIDQHAPF